MTSANALAPHFFADKDEYVLGSHKLSDNTCDWVKSFSPHYHEVHGMDTKNTLRNHGDDWHGSGHKNDGPSGATVGLMFMAMISGLGALLYVMFRVYCKRKNFTNHWIKEFGP